MTPHIFTEASNGVQTIEIRRPEKKNALTIEMYTVLAAAILRAENDDAVRVILIQGQPGVFTSGNDVQDFLNNPPSGLDAPAFQFLRALIHANKPVVASVAGNAVGIGTTLLLHCDFVLAGKSARFSTPFSNLGVCPEAASSVALPLLIGWRRATEMLLLGNAIDADTAHAWGLINRVVPDDELQAQSLATVQAIAAKPVQALSATKALMRNKLMPAFDAALAEEAREFGRLLQTPDSQEAFRAFLEKRTPKFAQSI